jgi:hypothetical protein
VDFHITEWNEHNHETIAEEIVKRVWLEKTHRTNAWSLATLAWRSSGAL